MKNKKLLIFILSTTIFKGKFTYSAEQPSDAGTYTQREELKEQAEQDRQLALALQQSMQTVAQSATQEEQKAAVEKATIDSAAEGLAVWFRREQEKLRKENPEMVGHQGQAGALKEFSKIISGFAAPVTWQSFEGESKILASGVRQIFLSPDRRYLLINLGKSSQLWDMTNIAAGPAKSFDAAFYDALFAADNRYLVTESNETLELWDMASLEKPIKTFVATSPVRHKAHFLLDGRYLAINSADSNNTFQFWDTNDIDGEPLHLFGDNVAEIYFSPQSHYVFVKYSHHEKRDSELWDLNNLNNGPLKAFDYYFNSKAYFSPDGYYFIIKFEKTAELWTADTLNQRPIKIFHETLSSAFFSQNSEQFILNYDNTCEIWDVHNLAHPIIRISDTSPSATAYANFLSNSQYFTTTFYESLGYNSKFWDLNNVAQGPVQHFGKNLASLRFSPNGQYVAATYNEYGKNRILKLWDINNLTIPITIFHEDVVTAFFSPDNQYLMVLAEGKVEIRNFIKIEQRIEAERIERASLEAENKKQANLHEAIKRIPRQQEGETFSDWINRFNRYSIEKAIPKKQ